MQSTDNVHYLLGNTGQESGRTQNGFCPNWLFTLREMCRLESTVGVDDTMVFFTHTPNLGN